MHKKNRLLGVLSPADRALINPHFEVMAWPRGCVVVKPNESIPYAYFPIDGIASVLGLNSSRRRYEVGMYGREGMGPTSVILGFDSTPNEHIVQAAGAALRIPHARLDEAMARSPTLRALLMGYTEAFNVQVGYTALSHGSDTLDERLARWLLMYRDRLDLDERLPLTVETLAMMLGIPQSEVAGAMLGLERVGITKTQGDMIKILDQDLLRQAAGRNYGIPEAEYQRFLGPAARRSI